MGPEKAAKWLGQWDPSVYLSRAAMPILWVTGTNDFAYPMDSLQKSYSLPRTPRTLCIRVRMAHAHGGPGENPEEIHAFADSISLKRPNLPTFRDQGINDATAWADFKYHRVIDRAELNYTTDTGRWQDRLWQSTRAELNTDAGRIKATLPHGTTVYYFNLITEGGMVVSTEHVELSSSPK